MWTRVRLSSPILSGNFGDRSQGTRMWKNPFRRANGIPEQHNQKNIKADLLGGLRSGLFSSLFRQRARVGGGLLLVVVHFLDDYHRVAANAAPLCAPTPEPGWLRPRTRWPRTTENTKRTRDLRNLFSPSFPAAQRRFEGIREDDRHLGESEESKLKNKNIQKKLSIGTI